MAALPKEGPRSRDAANEKNKQKQTRMKANKNIVYVERPSRMERRGANIDAPVSRKRRDREFGGRT